MSIETNVDGLDDLPAIEWRHEPEFTLDQRFAQVRYQMMVRESMIISAGKPRDLFVADIS